MTKIQLFFSEKHVNVVKYNQAGTSATWTASGQTFNYIASPYTFQVKLYKDYILKSVHFIPSNPNLKVKHDKYQYKITNDQANNSATFQIIARDGVTIEGAFNLSTAKISELVINTSEPSVLLKTQQKYVEQDIRINQVGAPGSYTKAEVDTMINNLNEAKLDQQTYATDKQALEQQLGTLTDAVTGTTDFINNNLPDTYATKKELSSKANSSDLNNYATSTDLNKKQDKLTAGTGISIVGNTISATGGGGSSFDPDLYYKKTETYSQNEVDTAISGVETQIAGHLEKNYTNNTDLANTYATKDSLTSYAKTSELSAYAKTATVYSKTDADSTFAKKTEVYSKTDVNNTFAKKSEIPTNVVQSTSTKKIVTLTQAEYDSQTHASDTLYLIIG